MICKTTNNEKQQQLAMCYTSIVFLKEKLQGLVAHSEQSASWALSLLPFSPVLPGRSLTTSDPWLGKGPHGTVGGARVKISIQLSNRAMKTCLTQLTDGHLCFLPLGQAKDVGYLAQHQLFDQVSLRPCSCPAPLLPGSTHGYLLVLPSRARVFLITTGSSEANRTARLERLSMLSLGAQFGSGQPAKDLKVQLG